MALTGKDATFNFNGASIAFTEYTGPEYDNQAYRRDNNKGGGRQQMGAAQIGAKFTLKAFFEENDVIPAIPMRTPQTLVAMLTASITLFSGSALCTKIGQAVPVQSGGSTVDLEFMSDGDFTGLLFSDT